MTRLNLRSRLLSFILVFAISLSTVPLPALAREVIEPTYTAPAAAAKSISDSGSLRYPIELDGDPDPASNPGSLRPVPVARFGDVMGKTTPIYYASIQLGVEVVPNNSQQNPADIPVTFHLWNNVAGTAHVDLKREIKADAWGAAFTDFLIDEVHLVANTPYFYQTSAPGYGETEVRSFTFDLKHFSSDTQLGGATIVTQIERDGHLRVDITSDRAIDDAPLAAQLLAARVHRTSASNHPQIEPLPPLVARRIDDHHARAELYLEAGEYALLATVQSGSIEAHSAPARVTIAQVSAPPIDHVENIISVDADGRSGLVQYRTASGDVAIMHHSLDQLPASKIPASTSQTKFTQTTRLGAFKFLEENYAINFETVADDGKKIITLDDFHYDPIERRYDLTIQSLQAKPIDDKLTVQVFGPNQVVIYEETLPITLAPNQPWHHSIAVPADRGEPYGLRVTVHDPAIIDGLITKTGELVLTVFTALRANAGAGVDLSLGGGLKAEFKILEILVASASIACQLDDIGCREPQYDGLIFQAPALWLDTISQGVRDFLRNNFGIKSIEESAINLAVNGLTLGSLTLAAYAAFRATYTLDVSCLTSSQQEAAKQALAATGRSMKDVIAAINFKAKPLLEHFQQQPWPEFPINTFLAVQISPVFAFSLDGGSDNLSLFAELQFQVGVGGSVILKPLSFVALAGLFDRIRMAAKSVGMFYTAFEIARLTGVLIANVSAVSQFRGTGGGACISDPPPPNGSPDDHRDALESQLLTQPLGASGNETYYQQQMAQAQRAGLTRAAAYWALQLRSIELADFDADTAEQLKEQTEINTLVNATEIKIQGLLSGTLPISPSQTITEAVVLTYDDFMSNLNNTTRDQQRRDLINSMNFAQRNYALLRGQELELQRELGRQLQSTGVGVVDGGLVTWALAALGSVGVAGVPVRIVQAPSSSGLPNSRYYTPYEAPPVLIVPSGGLHRFVESTQARDWLEAYTTHGGTLIVLSQAQREDWSMLPGGQVSGLGYEQDILCKTASVRIVNPSDWLIGLNRDLPDLQIDGSFTSIPANATVILMRTTGTQMPAMIEYAFGSGHVIAMTAYPDFYINGLQSREDEIFARSLFGLAYLKATGEPIAQTGNPNQPLTFAASLTNTAALTATSAQLLGNWYGTDVAEAWRWRSHPVFGASMSPLTPLVPPMSSGASRTITLTFNAPDQAGLFRTGWGLTAQQRTYAPGAFYQVRSTASGLLAHPVTVQLTRDRTYYNFGETAIVTATLINGEAATRVITLTPQVTGAAPLPITLGPLATSAVKVYEGPVYERRVLHVDVRENGDLLSQPLTVLELPPARFGLSLAPQKIFEDVATSLTVTATAQQVQPGTAITFELVLNDIALQAVTAQFTGDLNLATATATLNVPAMQTTDRLVVRARAASSSGTLAMNQTLPVSAFAKLRSVLVLKPLTLGALTPDAVGVIVSNDYPGAVIDVQPVVYKDDGTLLYGPTKSVTLTEAVHNISLDLPLPATQHERFERQVWISHTLRIPGVVTMPWNTSREAPLALFGPRLSAASSELVPGSTLALSLRPHSESNLATPNTPYTLTLRSLEVPFAYTVAVTGTPQLDGSFLLSLAVPTLPAHGLYRIDVQSPVLIDYYSSVVLRVPDRSFTFDAPTGALVNQTLAWSITSAVDLARPITVSLQLLDALGVIVAQNTISGTPTGSGRTLPGTLTLPAQLKTDQYRLRWQGTDDLGLAIEHEQVIGVSGLTSEIDVQPDRDIYTSSGVVNVTTTIYANDAISNTWLRWQIAPLPDAQSVTSTTLAGALSPADGVTRTARLSAHDIAYSHSGTFALITEQDPNVVRRLDLTTGHITTIAGGPFDAAGNIDGLGLNARFGLLNGLSLSPDDSYALIADQGNHTIRRLDLNTLAVTTLLHFPDTQQPADVAISHDGTFALFVDFGYHTIERIDLITNQVTTLAGMRNVWGFSDGLGAAARFTNPTDIVLNANSTVAYIYDYGNRRIRRFDLNTLQVTTPDLIGSDIWPAEAHLSLSLDGTTLFVSDEGSHTIARVLLATGERQVIAGQLDTRGDQDGVGAQARFEAPGGLSLNPNGQTALLAHQRSVRQINLSGPITVTTVVGQTGYNYDGVGATANFETVPGLAVSPNGAYALALDVQSLRRIDLATGVVTTVAGIRSLNGYTDGYTDTVRFWGPDQIAFSPDGAYALITNGAGDVRRYNAVTGEVTTITPQPANDYHLRGIAISHSGTFAVATDWLRDRIVRIDLLTNEISTIAGDATEEGSRDGIGTWALFNRPAGIALSPDDSLALITDYENHTIRRLDLATLEVRTLAGSAGHPGTLDGLGAEARLAYPFRIAFSPDGAYALVTTDGSDLDAVRRVDVATGRVRTLLQQAHPADSFHSIVWFNAIAFESDTTALVAQNWNRETRLLRLNLTSGMGPMLREDWVQLTDPVTGTHTLTITHAFTNPNVLSDPRARGRVAVLGTLFSVEPSGIISPALHHQLAAGQYTVVVHDNQPLVLEPEQTEVALGDGVTLHGIVVNTATQTSQITVTVKRDSTTFYTQTFALAPNEVRNFMANDFDPPLGEVTYVARSSKGVSTTAKATVLSALVVPELRFVPASVALGEETQLQIKLSNATSTAGTVYIVFGPDQDTTANVPAGQTVTVSLPWSFEQTGVITVPIEFFGAVNGLYNAVAYVGDEVPTATVVLTGALHSPTAVARTDQAGVALNLNNGLAWDYGTVVSYTLVGPENRSGAAPFWLHPGANTLPIDLSALALGTYTATFVVRHARLNTLLATTSLTFDLVEPHDDLALNTIVDPIDTAGNVTYTIGIANNPSGDRTFSGRVELSGAVDQQTPVTVTVGQVVTQTGSLNVLDRSGAQVIDIALTRVDGTPLVTRTLTINAAPRLAPQVTLTSLQANVLNDGTTDITVDLDNVGSAGDAALTLSAFDEDFRWLAPVSANGVTQAHYNVPAPAGVLSGTYPIDVRLGDQALHADVFIPGPEIDVQQHLDQPIYQPNAVAQWSVVLTGVSGLPASYDVLMRYRGEEHHQTVMLGAGDTVTAAWSFPVAAISDRATVLVSTATLNGGHHSVIIDSRWINVSEDERATITTDRDRYQAGDTVQLTLHLTPTKLALVYAPTIDQRLGDLLWTSLSYTQTDIVSGTFPLTYHLPSTMSTGRYVFRYLFDGEERRYPIDVFGYEVKVENLQATLGNGLERVTQAGPTTPIHVSAQLRLNQALSNAVISAYAVTPAGRYLDLGSSATITTNLPSGVTPIDLAGVLQAGQPGLYQIVLEVSTAADHISLSRDAIYREAGTALLNALTTNKGLYTPNELAQGTVTVYGHGSAQLGVQTSDGTALLQQTLILTGFQTLNFAVPTNTERDEVVIATLTDTLGMTSTLQVAYKVAATLDITAPQVALVAPANAAIVSYANSDHLVTVSGVITEDRAIDRVLINGQPATINGNTFATTLQLNNGANLFEVVAIDQAGNIGLGKLYTLYGEPSFGVTLSADPATVNVGGTITFTAVVTASDLLTATVLFPFSALHPNRSAGSVTTGTLVLTGTGVTWNGLVSPIAPVTVQWRSTTTQAMTQTTYAVVQSEQILPRKSSDTLIDIQPATTQYRIYLPIVKR